MRLLYDHQIFWLQRYGGISRYYVELVERLMERPDIEIRISSWHSENAHLRSSRLAADGTVPFRPRRCQAAAWVGRHAKRELVRDLQRRTSVKALREGRADLFHPTYYDPYFLEHLDGTPFVLTVYDMTHETVPQMFPPHDPTSGNKRLLVERAERIVAISESTKRDLVRICGVPSSKVTVVHLASSLNPACALPRLDGLPERYVLFVGNRWTYKNFERFARALSPVMREEKDLWLVCAGGGPLEEWERRTLDELGMTSRTHHIGIDDPTLAHLYRHAQAFAFPSLYEGFGIPVLEAFACGCPVLASDRSSLPEVVGEAGVLFDPEDEASMAEAVSRVLADGELRRRLAEKGRERAKLFSWDLVAERHRELYEGLA